MPEFESVLSDASQLSVPDQLRLIDELSASVPDDQPPSLTSAWIAEIECRSAEIDAGTVQTIPWEDVKQRLSKAAGTNGEN